MPSAPEEKGEKYHAYMRKHPSLSLHLPLPRHGKCCECVAHHRDREGGVPGCFFTKEGEATYDRSVAALWRDYNNRK